MPNRRFLLLALSAFGASAAMLPMALHSRSFAASAMADLDKDNDGTLDIDEVKGAAGATFDKLERDADATLDVKEAGAHIGKKEFKAADADHDGTLTKDEYVGHAEKLFKPADTDGDGTLDSKELRSKAGRALLRSIR
jgi:Ca2+-binding EF-hand superfamily protein